ncbi:MAG: fumarylacetoacetase [Ilumatobacteraceae bacterium]
MTTGWVAVPDGSPFPLHNLPFGIGRRDDGTVGAFVAIGDHALDLGEAVGTGFLDDSPAEYGLLDKHGKLNGFAAAGRAVHTALRARLTELFTDERYQVQLTPYLVPIAELTMQVPIVVGDYVDFYSSLHHATNLGRLFRPDGEPLLPNWRHLPIGYHGRSGTIVADGADVPRPSGLRLVDGEPEYGPSKALDIELEVGVVVGAPSERGHPIAAADAEQHLFGLCLVNDWSARDIQAFEYQPLGPFLGKSFATSMSPWIVTLDALDPFRVDPPEQDPPVADHLRTIGPTGFDLHLEVELNGQIVSENSFADMYWTPAQQLAHMTTNGASVRAGDLFASGTVSGPTPGSEGSLIELTWRGERPITLADGTTRTFLEDGDTVTLRGWAGSEPATRIGLGSVTGTITTGA